MEMMNAKHFVRPSHPTPQAFRNHKLSYLDQLAPLSYIPLIFFYKNGESKPPHEISQCLNQSLSKTLTIFYPLAGTIKNNLYVDCNDRGVEFVEVRVHARLTQFLDDPKMEELRKLVPADSVSHKDDDPILSVKVSYFDCGGVVVAICLSHKIADGASITAFMNAWALTCKGEASQVIHPSFDLALHFPPRDDLPLNSGYSQGFTKEKIVTKRLTFEHKMLDKLRKQTAASSKGVKDPTRVETVSVFIWKSLIEAHKAKSQMTKASAFVASHAVNLRPRTFSKMLDQTFGNCFLPTSAVASWDEDDLLLSRMRASIRAINDDHINKAMKDNNNSSQAQDKIDDVFKPENCLFSSWCRFPVYDVDFGWGKPDWVSSKTLQYMNLFVLMSTPSEDGIEAWINAPEKLSESLQASYNKLFT